MLVYILQICIGVGLHFFLLPTIYSGQAGDGNQVTAFGVDDIEGMTILPGGVANEIMEFGPAVGVLTRGQALVFDP